MRYDAATKDLTVSAFLTGPLGLLPLAPLAAVGAADLPVVAGMKARIDPIPERPLADKLWAATNILIGLRFNEAVVNNVLSGVRNMKESVTYQAILREGRAEGVA